VAQHQPNTARIYDYWLGGTHHFPEDRELGERMKQVVPDIEQVARANRAFLRRAVRVMARAGIDQFLDLGSGLPSEGNVHETAREVNPAARTVYVDIDPVTAEFGRAMLLGTPGVELLTADLRDVESVLGSDEVGRCLDLSRPVGLLMVAMLQFVPDQDDPAAVVAAYRDACAPGSYLVVSHVTTEYNPQQVRAATQAYKPATLPFTPRSRAKIASLLGGYELLPPGLVDVIHWRLDLQDVGSADPLGGDVARYSLLAAVGRRVD
jgi:hypothetical protein